MNWLLGGNAGGSEAPETPVHRWAMNAFKGAIMPEGLYGSGQLLGESPCAGNPNSSILKTPGQTKDKRRVTVTFHKSVHTPPKRTNRSGLPNAFPGKFPSPWTPKLGKEQQNRDDNEALVLNDSPISVDKDRREHSRFANPLKGVSPQLKSASSIAEAVQPCEKPHRRPSIAIAKEPTNRRSAKNTRPRALSWDVDRGFDEVLASISKNNAYLQSLIDEMQESCAFGNESFADGPSMVDSEITTNIDEPASSSGQYWKKKFLDFSDVTQRVKSEQDKMEQALAQLRLDVQARTAEDQENWKDKYDLLKEELDKERKATRSSAHLREMRDLRRTVRDLQNKAGEVTELQKQLQIADLQIKDFEKQMESNRAAAKEYQAAPQRDDHAPVSIRTTTISPTSSGHIGSLGMTPQSSTSKRLEKAKLAAMNTAESRTDMALARDTRQDSNVAGIKSAFTQVSRHRRFGSRTLVAPVHTDSENMQPETTPTITNVTLGTQYAYTEKQSKVSSMVFSPRPKFVDLDINSCDRTIGNKAASTDVKGGNAEPLSAEQIKRREAARRRLDQRKAEKDRAAAQV